MNSTQSDSQSAGDTQIAPIVQFLLGIGFAVVETGLIFAITMFGIPMRFGGWLVVMIVNWLVVFLMLRRTLFSMTVGLLAGIAVAWILQMIFLPVTPR